MSIEHIALPLVGAFVVGVGAGYVGSLMVLRRMSLVGDALSHVALPGLAMALLINVNPLLGAFVALLIAVIGIWLLEQRTALPSETLVGIFFTLSLAAGLLLTPGHELLEALFGDISQVTSTDISITIAAVVVVATLLSRITHQLVLSIISPDLAKASGVNTRRINLLFLLAVALIVALGIKVTGTLLTGALVIIPAAAARNISSSLSQFMVISALFGALAGVGGVLAAYALGLAPGPIIVLTGGLVFVASLLVRK
jgi:ABC-type Mn2+/Zn2+ transport system permease subunit